MATARAKHILVETEEECNDLINQLKEGAEFSVLAQENSKCPSGQQGGDLGSFQNGQMVPEFDQVIFNEKLGLYTKPVQTQFGYHVIFIDEREDDKSGEPS
jgi:peptidyl-prolyl cis-trans isomerase C